MASVTSAEPRAVLERAQRMVGHRDADGLAGLRVVVLHGGVEVEAAVALHHLRGPGVAHGPLEVGGLHDGAVGGPVAQVLGRIAQPLLHEEEVVALGLVMAHVEVDRVAHDQRRGVGGEAVAQHRIGAGRRFGGRRQTPCQSEAGAREERKDDESFAA